MTVLEAIQKRRSIRKFKQDQKVTVDQLKTLVEAGRLAPQAANVQPVRFSIVQSEEMVEKVFATTKWAGYLEDYAPKNGEHPTGFIVILAEKALMRVYTGADIGAVVENMLLAAVEMDLGTCWIASVDKEKVAEMLSISDDYEIHSVIAVGYPAEDPCWEEKKDDSIRYYLDENQKIHVPKRTMEEVLINVN